MRARWYVALLATLPMDQLRARYRWTAKDLGGPIKAGVVLDNEDPMRGPPCVYVRLRLACVVYVHTTLIQHSLPRRLTQAPQMQS